MIDLHCHLLPGVDDGPKTLEESLQMCRMAVEDGITRAVVTPHIHPGRWRNTKAGIAKATEALQRSLDEEGIELSLGYAAEVRLTDQIMGQVERDEIPFYGEVDGYRIMLLEFPHSHIIPGSENIVSWLLERGIRPLIAHPERNKQIMKDTALVQPFVQKGCWLQSTAGALLGKFGERAESACRQLLGDNLITVFASDAHNSSTRPPQMAAAFQQALAVVGDAQARRLFNRRPALITQAAA